MTGCYEVGEPDDPRAGTFFYGRLNPATGEIEVDDEKLRRLRTLTVEHKPACADCFCKWTCAGECASKPALEGNAWDPSGNPRCPSIASSRWTRCAPTSCAEADASARRRQHDRETSRAVSEAANRAA